MTIEEFKAMMKDVILEVDYDAWKQFDVETAEEPEFVEERWADIVTAAQKHINIIDLAPWIKEEI